MLLTIFADMNEYPLHIEDKTPESIVKEFSDTFGYPDTELFKLFILSKITGKTYQNIESYHIKTDLEFIQYLHSQGLLTILEYKFDTEI